jgi:glycosyltransferase involved in cell wall biosynthesis
MTIPLSYVLPVHNAEAWLQRKVEALLDDLAEQAERFELLVIDDGSLDETALVARQLAATYPQVTFVRRELRYGSDAALQFAARKAKGQRIVVIQKSPERSGRATFRRIEIPGETPNPRPMAAHARPSSAATREISTS